MAFKLQEGEYAVTKQFVLYLKKRQFGKQEPSSLRTKQFVLSRESLVLRCKKDVSGSCLSFYYPSFIDD
jgi:hypothetical protein